MRQLHNRLFHRKDIVEKVAAVKLEARAAGLHEDNPDVLYLILAEQRSVRARLEWGLGVASVMAAVGLYHVLNTGV